MDIQAALFTILRSVSHLVCDLAVVVVVVVVLDLGKSLFRL